MEGGPQDGMPIKGLSPRLQEGGEIMIPQAKDPLLQEYAAGRLPQSVQQHSLLRRRESVDILDSVLHKRDLIRLTTHAALTLLTTSPRWCSWIDSSNRLRARTGTGSPPAMGR